MYVEALIYENSDDSIVELVLEEATFDFLMENGDEAADDLENYINLLESEEYDPSPDFEEHLIISEGGLFDYVERTVPFFESVLYEATPAERQKIMNMYGDDLKAASGVMGGEAVRRKASASKGPENTGGLTKDVQQGAPKKSRFTASEKQKNQFDKELEGQKGPAIKQTLWTRLKNTRLGRMTGAMKKGLQKYRGQAGKMASKAMGRVHTKGKDMARSGRRGGEMLQKLGIAGGNVSKFAGGAKDPGKKREITKRASRTGGRYSSYRPSAAKA